MSNGAGDGSAGVTGAGTGEASMSGGVGGAVWRRWWYEF